MFPIVFQPVFLLVWLMQALVPNSSTFPCVYSRPCLDWYNRRHKHRIWNQDILCNILLLFTVDLRTKQPVFVCIVLKINFQTFWHAKSSRSHFWKWHVWHVSFIWGCFNVFYVLVWIDALKAEAPCPSCKDGSSDAWWTENVFAFLAHVAVPSGVYLFYVLCKLTHRSN